MAYTVMSFTSFPGHLAGCASCAATSSQLPDFLVSVDRSWWKGFHKFSAATCTKPGGQRTVVRQRVVGGWQVYETVLAAALATQGCGARSLALGGPWRWLLKEVRQPHTSKPIRAHLSNLSGCSLLEFSNGHSLHACLWP